VRRNNLWNPWIFRSEFRSELLCYVDILSDKSGMQSEIILGHIVVRVPLEHDFRDFYQLRGFTFREVMVEEAEGSGIGIGVVALTTCLRPQEDAKFLIPGPFLREVNE